MTHLPVILSFLLSVSGFMIHKPLNKTDSYHFRLVQELLGDVGKPLYLTPLIEKGNIRKAQKLSTVRLPHLKEIRSFSGYLTVNKECESNLFFWFFPAQENWRKAPVLLWLQGGPGASSLFGLFEELGPITIINKLEKRHYSWNVKNNLLFIDQPVGTGFSFTGKHCYATNETEVSRDLYSALTQFYQLFPSLQNNKFYITGESYGGHYVPSIANAIHKNNPSAKTKINLSGLMIGNGLMDAMYQYDYSSYVYQLGLVDNRQRDVSQKMEFEVLEHLKKEDWVSGYNTWNDNLNYLKTCIGNISEYNFLNSREDTSAATSPWEEFLNTPKVRKSIHVGNNTFHRDDKVFDCLTNDIVQSVKPEVEALLEHYPVIFYNGQLDIICAYPMAVNFFRSLQWSGAIDYLQAERHQWCVQDQLAGYFKSAHNLHEVLVRDAGHMVPRDQPLWAFQLMNSVTSSPAHDPLRQLRTCGNSAGLIL